jgi:hypothetical protein
MHRTARIERESLFTATKKNSGQKDKGTEKYLLGLRPPPFPAYASVIFLSLYFSVQFSVPFAVRTRWAIRGPFQFHFE